MILFSTKSSTITHYQCYVKNCDPFFPAHLFLNFEIYQLKFSNKRSGFTFLRALDYLILKELTYMHCKLYNICTIHERKTLKEIPF